MAKHTRLVVLSAMKEIGLVPVFYNGDFEVAKAVGMSEWLGAGAVCVGMGSKLITKELLAAKDYAGISKNVKEAVELIKKIRAK